MTKQEYTEYEFAVANFMAREGIKYLATGYLVCPICGLEFEGYCSCGAVAIDESFFSWQPCECCGTTLGGSREHATALNLVGKICEYTICTDCAYYAEYGELDDTTMELT